MKRLFFELIAKHIIYYNYLLRYESALRQDGKHPDEWFWLDYWASKNGFYITKPLKRPKIYL